MVPNWTLNRNREEQKYGSDPGYGQEHSAIKVYVAALIERERALLLLRSETALADPLSNTWRLPGGPYRGDEPPSATVVRAIREEAGWPAQAGRLMDACFFDEDLWGKGLLLVYEARIAEDGWKERSDKTLIARFFPADQVPQPLAGGGHRLAILAWQSRALDRWQAGLPPRYCPHCAHPLEEKEAFDRLRLTCPVCGYVHFRDPKAGVSVVVEQNGQILLVQRAIEPGQGLWGLPSGFIEWDESAEHAAIRECQEETGLTVDNLQLLEVTHYTEDFRGPGINLTFRAEVVGGRLHPGDEALAARFFAPAELPSPGQIAFASHYRLLERWRSSTANRGLFDLAEH